jgi:type IV pilus assembly protein PilX
MGNLKQKQQGFVLIVSLILLAVVTILVVSGMGVTTMSERMSGNHMDRNRAQAAAEQALSQGLALLQANGEVCLTGCDETNTSGTAASSTLTTAPTAWSDTNAKAVTRTGDQKTTASFLITWLNNAFFITGKTDCQAYSVMGKGTGLNAQSVVVLQMIAYVCPTD